MIKRLSERKLKITPNKYADALSVTDYITNITIDADLKELCGYIVLKFREIIRDEGLEDTIKISDDAVIDNEIFVTISTMDEDYFIETLFRFDIDNYSDKITLFCDMRRDRNMVWITDMSELDDFLNRAVHKLCDKFM